MTGALAGERIDVLKIDVEGHEELVLRGAKCLLHSPAQPRAVFIEVHPYAWGPLGTTSDSLFRLLREAGYRTESVRGEHILSVERYGEIVARI